MPAEKGIPKPESSARRLDVRNYDSREAWGWISEDERLIMSKEGVAYVEPSVAPMFIRDNNVLKIRCGIDSAGFI